MDKSSYRRVMELFDAACDLPRAEQLQMVARLAEREAQLAARLAKMLEHDAAETEPLAPGQAARALARAVQGAPPEVAADARRWRQGRCLEGYRVGAWLGQGSMGSVHRGRHLKSGAEVAIKFLRGPYDEVGVRRLRREFATLSQLSHPGCVKVFTHGHGQLGHYLVMQYVAGGDLRAWIGRRGILQLQLVAQVARALGYIHRCGVVHRDLKPANVLLTAGAPVRALLVDFGIAKSLDTSSLLTGSNELLGSLDFLSPEQCRSRRADGRSDLYSLGCLLHVLWSGRAPFEGDTIDRLAARTRSRPALLGSLVPGTPPALSELVQQLMSPDPTERPADADQVADRLERLAAQLRAAPAGRVRARERDEHDAE